MSTNFPPSAPVNSLTDSCDCRHYSPLTGSSGLCGPSGLLFFFIFYFCPSLVSSACLVKHVGRRKNAHCKIPSLKNQRDPDRIQLHPQPAQPPTSPLGDHCRLHDATGRQRSAGPLSRSVAAFGRETLRRTPARVIAQRGTLHFLLVGYAVYTEIFRTITNGSGIWTRHANLPD